MTTAQQALNNVSLKDIPAILPLLSLAEQEKLLAELEKLQDLKLRKRAQTRFLAFVREVWPTFISGRHHAKMAAAFEKVADGTIKRLIINMPPRHTKSEFASYLLPAWFLGKFPHKKIIQTAHTAELAVGFGRKVRNLVDQEVYAKIFPGVGLQADSKAAGRWNTNKQGDYFAIGVGGAVTGKGADLLIIDDPHSEQEAALAETNPDVYDKVYEWYTSGPRQRLQPGGAIVIVMCMTGETPVLMADGVEKPLADIRPGDVVATFEQGRLTTAKVNNWRSSGVDSVYRIQTKSGRILRANERHPFLVMNEGVLEWTRLNQLQVGDELVSLKDAIGRHGQRQNSECAGPVRPESLTIAKIQTHRASQLEAMAGGLENYANAAIQSTVKDFALPVTGSNTRLQNQHQSETGKDASNTATESLLRSMSEWWKSAKTSVMSAAKSLLPKIPAHIGAGSYASIMITPQGASGGFSAMTATWRSDTARRQAFLNALQRTSDFITDQIVSISYDGEEEVFDVEIDRTENFIANGVVSHNTRWSQRDLTGQVLKSAAMRGDESWEVIEFPALFEDEPDEDGAVPDPRPLWPEFWSLDELLSIKEELPVHKWNAQYQQAPTSREGAIIKRDWWRIWEGERHPPCEFIIQSWDTAFEKSNRADYSACTTWGVFVNEEDNDGKGAHNIILLDAFRDRMEFPELKRVALKHYSMWNTDTSPVSLIVEKKASGAPLIYELRAMGIPVQEFTPSKGQDKISRLNAVSDLFASGRIWVPETRWAEELVEEVAAFPAGEHDDYVDAMTLALMRYRQGGYVRSVMDEPEPTRYFKRRTKGFY
jgi:predicted phage terminase large subunit-like protein